MCDCGRSVDIKDMIVWKKRFKVFGKKIKYWGCPYCGMAWELIKINIYNI